MSIQVTLGKLIERLEVLPGNGAWDGLIDPHSYRGFYQQIGFSRARTTFGKSKALATQSIGSVFRGYKGGQFTMTAETPVWLSSRGGEGRELTETLLETMILGAMVDGACYLLDAGSCLELARVNSPNYYNVMAAFGDAIDYTENFTRINFLLPRAINSHELETLHILVDDVSEMEIIPFIDRGVACLRIAITLESV
jgi:hypothetical protein